jgi:hypothetical protein
MTLSTRLTVGVRTLLGVGALSCVVGGAPLGEASTGENVKRPRQGCAKAVRAAGGAGRVVIIRPKANLRRAVAAHPRGTTFCLKAGVHRLTQPVTPKTNQKFVGEPGAVVSGAKDISRQFVASDSYWVASNQTQRNSARTGICWPSGETACQYAEDVFLDNKPLWRVLSLSQLGPGRFFFDYGASKIYIADNPAGHKVEAAMATRAFVASGSGVTIRGLTVERFANEAGAGAIWAGDSWLIENNEVRFNHGVGIKNGQIIRRNYIHHNLQIGIRSISTSGQLVEGNEIAYNTYGERFHSFQDTGGGKLSKTLNLTVRSNHVHHNRGTGLSTDWDNKGVLYENNRFEHNDGPGIIHEASYDAVIRNNVVRRNGFRIHTGSIDGSGILVQSSANTAIYGNRVERNKHGIGLVQSRRGPGMYGEHKVHDVDVHDNFVSTVANGIAAGLVGGEDDPRIYCCKSIRFESNVYVTCQRAGTKPGRWAWKRNAAGTPYISKAEWIAAGHDDTGRFRTLC